MNQVFQNLARFRVKGKPVYGLVQNNFVAAAQGKNEELLNKALKGKRDVILTPLGVPSRMNLGQILELHLGLAANTLGYQAVVPPFAGATADEIQEELVSAGFDTLVAAGYQPEVAYFECLHEMKLIVDLMYEGGMSWMRHSISDTAEYGDYTRGPRVVDDHARTEMQRILGEIQDGTFAKEWIGEAGKGFPRFRELRAAARSSRLEEVGKRLRGMMPWLESERKVAPDA